MESNYGALFSKLFFLTEVFKYYGYTDENYVLISQLHHKSRSFLFQEMPTFIQNSMFSKRRDLTIIQSILFDEAEALVKTNKCSLYNLTISVNGKQSFKALDHLLDNAKAKSEICYSKINCYIDYNSVHFFNKSIKKMKNLDYDLSVVAINECFEKYNHYKINLEYNPYCSSIDTLNISKEIHTLCFSKSKNMHNTVKYKLDKNRLLIFLL